MFCQNVFIYFNAFLYTYLNLSLCQWTIWCQDLYGIRKTPKYGKGSYNSIVHMFYYWAANIRSMLFWKDSPSGDTTPEWLRMKNSSCPHTSLCSLLCSKLPLLESISKFTLNPIVKNSFRILTQFKRAFSVRDLPTCALNVLTEELPQ